MAAGLRDRLSDLLRRLRGGRSGASVPADLADQPAVRDLAGRLIMASPGAPPEVSASTGAGRAGVFLFCGPASGHGTSSVAAAVARILAEAGKRTVLAVAGPSGQGPEAIPLEDSLRSGGALRFGQPPLVRLQVPDAFLDLPEAARAPARWASGFDFLLVDAPAMPAFLTRYWVPLAQGVILVVDGERTSVRAVAAIRDEIAGLGGALAGVVLNRHRSRVPAFLHG
jgi:Mrp family chromosome partitioning ATPase